MKKKPQNKVSIAEKVIPKNDPKSTRPNPKKPLNKVSISERPPKQK